MSVSAARPFVILRHETRGEVHFDWLFDLGGGDDGDGRLAAWKFPLPPLAASAAGIVGVRQFDHRRRYLTYEGPVGRERGTVRIVVSGMARLVAIEFPAPVRERGAAGNASASAVLMPAAVGVAARLLGASVPIDFDGLRERLALGRAAGHPGAYRVASAAGCEPVLSGVLLRLAEPGPPPATPADPAVAWAWVPTRLGSAPRD